MVASPSDRKISRPIVMASLVGMVISLPALALCCAIGGGGHGSVLPLHTCFAPVCLVVRLMPSQSGSSLLELSLAILGSLGLYGVYGGIIAYARANRAGVRVLLVILTIHYASLIWLAVRFESSDRLPDLAATMAKFPIVHSVAVVEMLVALHLLAFQFASSALPYRPRMTWPVAVTLVVGLVAGVALYVWGCASA